MSVSNIRRVCFALDLVNDAELIAAYEAAHAPGAIWPEVAKGIYASGYESMEIWRTGDRLFMIAEVSNVWPAALDPETQAIDDKWQINMDRFQKRLPHGDPNEKWTPMARIFNLADQ
jgi:L-rhamnose mutarotase